MRELNVGFFLLVVLGSAFFSFSLAQPPSTLTSLNFTDVLLRGVCEPFDHFPQHCTGVMVKDWSQVWVAPSFGLTQEFWVGMMYPSLDIVPLLSSGCARQYLKFTCAIHLRPCNLTYLHEGRVLPAPQPICRSVCEVRPIPCFWASFFSISCLFLTFFFSPIIPGDEPCLCSRF